MILIVTNKTDYTADYLILGLLERGIPFVRFNTEDFPTRITLDIDIVQGNLTGHLTIDQHVVNLADIASVWYRRPIPSTPAVVIQDPGAQEYVIGESAATLQSLWRLLRCTWVSHPDSLRQAESKLYQLQMAATIGFRVPATKVTNDPDAAEAWYRAVDGSVIYKPQHHGRIVRGDTVSLIYTNVIKPHHATQFDSVQYAPVLLQPYISKDYEVRATVVGQQVFAAALASQTVPEAQHDWRRVDAGDLPHTPHHLPPVVEAQCIALVQELGLAFGAIDLIVTPDGDYVFLEINPNGQWAWIQQLCPELQICEALINLLNGKGSNHAEASTAHEPA